MQSPLQFLFVAETTDVDAMLAVLRQREAGSATIHLRRLDDGALVEVLSPPAVRRTLALRVGRELARLPAARSVKVVAVRRPRDAGAKARFVRQELASWTRTAPRQAA